MKQLVARQCIYNIDNGQLHFHSLGGPQEQNALVYCFNLTLQRLLNYRLNSSIPQMWPLAN